MNRTFEHSAANVPEEPISIDAALFTNDHFGLDGPSIYSGKLVLFQVNYMDPRNKGIVRCCLGERSLPALYELYQGFCARKRLLSYNPDSMGLFLGDA